VDKPTMIKGYEIKSVTEFLELYDDLYPHFGVRPRAVFAMELSWILGNVFGCRYRDILDGKPLPKILKKESREIEREMVCFLLRFQAGTLDESLKDVGEMLLLG